MNWWPFLATLASLVAQLVFWTSVFVVMVPVWLVLGSAMAIADWLHDEWESRA